MSLISIIPFVGSNSPVSKFIKVVFPLPLCPIKPTLSPLLISIFIFLIVLVIVLLLFGRGKIPQLMGDMAKGIKSFKKGMSDEDKKEDKNIENNSDNEK